VTGRNSVTSYCWHCYGENKRDEGPCVHCGRSIEPPPDVTYDDRLIWALRHPLRENRMIAAQLLGVRRVAAARQPLRALALDWEDPYLSVEALRSLIAIEGAAATDLLKRLASSGPAIVKREAQRALAELGRGAQGE
jgi:hypothetical protein